MDNIDTLIAALPRLGEGVLVTLQLVLGGAALALVVAVVLGLSASHHAVLVRGMARAFMEFFRGTSLLIQLFWIFYVLPQLFDIQLGSLTTGIIALGLNYGAYGSEVVRGSINAVPKGQWEVSTALSLSKFQRMRRVIFPQAWVIMIPSLTNLLIMLLKGSALASVILLNDLTYVIEEGLRRETGTYFAFGVGLVIYFVIAYLLAMLMNAVEVRAKHKLGTGPPLREVLRIKPETGGSSA